MTNHLDIVQQQYEALRARGWQFLGAEGIFELTKRVAWALKDEGFGLLKKVTGNQAFGYSTDKILSGDFYIVDIFSDDGKGGGIPRWTVGGLFPANGWHAPFDPDGPVVPNDEAPSGTPTGSNAKGSSPIVTVTHPSIVTPQLGLLEDDIVYRLSLLAVNVLQPLKDKYPNVVVVSGFRQVNTGVGQHELGEAVDIQIRNQTAAQLYEVADYIQKFLNFDQLVLNWTDVGDGQGWIHVSFSPMTLRGQVLTKDFADSFHEGLFLCDPYTGEEAAAVLRTQADDDAAVMQELQNLQARQNRNNPNAAKSA